MHGTAEELCCSAQGLRPRDGHRAHQRLLSHDGKGSRWRRGGYSLLSTAAGLGVRLLGVPAFIQHILAGRLAARADTAWHQQKSNLSRPTAGLRVVAGGVVKDAITDGSSLGPRGRGSSCGLYACTPADHGLPDPPRGSPPSCKAAPGTQRRLRAGRGEAPSGAALRQVAPACRCEGVQQPFGGKNLPECQRVAATACGRCRGVGCGGGSCRWRSAAGSPAAQPSGVAVRPKPAIPDWGPPSLRGTPPSGRRDRGFQGRPRAAKVKGKGGEEPPQA